MLCQFSVRNYKCICDEITLDMQATAISEHPESLLLGKDGEAFLPLAVIYGPNGAGKSTVLSALRDLLSRIVFPLVATSNIKSSLRMPLSTPYRFSEKTQAMPTEFELFFRTSSTEYHYQLSILKDKIIHESLAYKKLAKGRYTSLFERNKNNIIKHGVVKKYETSGLSEDLPLLSFFAITHSRNEIIKDIMFWLIHQFNFIDYADPRHDTDIFFTVEPEEKILILDMLQEMDIDISDYHIREIGNREYEIYITHEVAGKRYELEIDEESSGSQKIFSLLPRLAKCLFYGGVLVADELDAKLHPLLLKYIIQLFRDPQKNLNHAQLIFTSHDLSTMNSELFRRDEIWFVAKSAEQATKLYSLVEFGTRKDAKFDKQYLEGRYGADPYLRKIIDWEKVNTGDFE